jgi:BirA family transcriptional regulator, biotin operon repressor / biotin---[acetyl-CoA-carboxylase] ligase
VKSTGLDLDEVRRRLAQTPGPARELHYFDSVDSTMVNASRLAESGAASGTVVVAEEQTAGQGRLGRRWHSAWGTGLYFSVVLRLQVAPQVLPAITMACGLAVADGIAHSSAVACDLRWPNDVIVQEKKCAGILVQAERAAVIAGIGINVNQAEFPEDVAGLATSLRIATGQPQRREHLLAEVLTALDHYANMLATQGRPRIFESFAARSSYVRGKRVAVEQGAAVITGVTDGLDSAGFLYVREDSGKRTLILAGGVRPLED